ncbi:MAG: sugar phosphate isomerase/epimerase [Verrucomicrobia bacterium]|nr:sugar phosphate isomerase/epimerase [Verrucomicrobiota bacterium]
MTRLQHDDRDRLTRRDFLGRTAAAAAGGWFVGRQSVLGAPVPPGAPPAMGWQIGCYTRPWAACEYGEAFDVIAEAGFKYIGFSGIKSATKRVIAPATPLEEAAKMGEEARRRGLQIPNAYGGAFASDRSVKDGVESLRRMIDNCAAAGVWSLMVGSLGTEKTYENHCKAIAEVCDYAAEKRVGIVLKPHGGLTSPGPLLRKACDAVRHKNFSVMYDPGNIYYYSDGKVDPVEDAAVLDGIVSGMCVKDYQHPKNVAVTPGTGQVKFPNLMARLAKGGFTHGPLIIETLAPGDPAQLIHEARKGRLFVEQLVAGTR